VREAAGASPAAQVRRRRLLLLLLLPPPMLLPPLLPLLLPPLPLLLPRCCSSPSPPAFPQVLRLLSELKSAGDAQPASRPLPPAWHDERRNVGLDLSWYIRTPTPPPSVWIP